ncbi:hypothetical protein BH18VER1_BH18VER1_11850 [soil metagenome]
MRARPEQWPRVNELFDAAAELREPERTRFLEKECAGDRALRVEMESLLASDAAASEFIEEPVGTLPLELFAESNPEIAGQQFGAYRIVREIGRGGLGTVYLAERADDAYRKEVALKLVRRGLDTDDILRRFRHERQILAQLDHPHIARLIDGGTTEEGLPYFVMEYVQGATLLEFCDRQKLDAEARLQLFRKVCDAVSYAHQNLVIHRDLKPSNILVTEDGTPKLLDFGIAKLLTPAEEAMTQTVPALRVMTPEYASPEQIKGGAITTGSDVYSLGVLLYELLTGQKPYRLTSRSAEEVSRAVTNQEPTRPSRAIAEGKNSDFDIRVSNFLQRDLDNIVLMALRKEPERRYATVERFSEDIRRHLEGLPVSAHKDTFQYRTAKFVRRNKTGVLAALLVLLALFAGLVATLWQSHIAQTERARAEKRFNDVRQLANSNLFEVYPKVERLEGSIEAREAILKNALTYLDSLVNETGDDLKLKSELATAYEKVGDVQGAASLSLGNYKTAFETYARAQQLREAVYEADPKNLEAKEKLAKIYQILGRSSWYDDRTQDAEEFYRKSLKLRRELVAAQPDSVETQNNLAQLLINAGAIPEFSYQIENALPYFEEALAIIQKERRQHPEHVGLKKSLTSVMKYLGRVKAAQRDFAGGLRDLKQAVEISRELAQQFPEDFGLQRDVWLSETQICDLYNDQGDDGPAAVEACLKSIAFPYAAAQKEPESAGLQRDLAGAYGAAARASYIAKDYSRAVEQADKALQTMDGLVQKFPESAAHKYSQAGYRTTKAESLIELAQFDPALAELQPAGETFREIIKADPAVAINHLDLAKVYRASGRAYHRQGNDEKALEYVDQAIVQVEGLARLEAIPGSDNELMAKLQKEIAEYAK